MMTSSDSFHQHSVPSKSESFKSIKASAADKQHICNCPASICGLPSRKHPSRAGTGRAWDHRYPPADVVGRCSKSMSPTEMQGCMGHALSILLLHLHSTKYLFSFLCRSDQPEAGLPVLQMLFVSEKKTSPFVAPQTETETSRAHAACLRRAAWPIDSFSSSYSCMLSGEASCPMLSAE